jgi:ABC-type transport system involved in multi-copper enzyme maturation permease subunit
VDPLILDTEAFVGGTLFGLAMFSTLFLGAVLAIFLTLGVVRGDSEAGLLQPVVVRPIGRATLLVARFTAAAALSVVYVAIVYTATLLITLAAGDWAPDHVLGPGLGLALGVAIIAAISVLASVFLAGTAQGIAIFMVFGAGLTAGLLGQIGEAINSDTLGSISAVATWGLPFEALYQAGLAALVSDTEGLTGVVLQLGPFGGAESGGVQLVLWSVVYLAGALLVSIRAFSRRDL